MNLRRAARNLNRMMLPETKSPISVKTFWFQLHLESPKEKPYRHHHSFFEAHFIQKGCVHYRFGNNIDITVCAGEWLLIAPEQMHTVLRTENGFQKFSLGFSFEDIQTNPLSDAVNALLCEKPFRIAKESDACRALFAEALTAADHFTPLSPFRIQNTVLALTDELARACGELPQVQPLPSLSAEDVRVARAKRFITDNIRTSFTSADVAANVHLCEKQLSRIFRDSEGEAISDFIRKEKLKEAKRLLCASNAPLREISELLGYSNEYNFIRFFRNAEGMTPGMFRKAANAREK